MRHTLRVALGIGLSLLGIVGLLVPIMPGWIFLIPGLLILADYYPPIGRLVNYFRAKFKEAEVGFRKSGKQADPETPAEGSHGATRESTLECPEGRGTPSDRNSSSLN